MAFEPPIGIPDPAVDFGWEIDRATPAWPASWSAGPPTPTANFYYIDNTAGNATDSGNTYGSPAVPRLTIPEGALLAGAFIYVHAGTYTSQGDRFNWHGPGTTTDPIWITGNPSVHPILANFVHPGDSGELTFFVLENFSLAGGGAHIELRPGTDGEDINHILIRYCEMTGAQIAGEAGGVGIGVNSSSDPTPNSLISYVVVYSCTISNYGDFVDSDIAGVICGYHVDYVWVVDNEIFSIAGDSVAGSHYSNYTTRLTEHYYVGGNLMYGNAENGLDFKAVRYGVASQNEIYGPFTREQGWAAVYHYGADSNFKCRDCAFIFNRVYHCSGGFYLSSSGCDNFFVVGNLFYDIDSSYAAQPDSLNGLCVYVAGSNGTNFIVDNDCYDYERGIYVSNLTGADSLEIHGNIMNFRSAALQYELEMVNGQEVFVQDDYNFYPASARFFYTNSTRTLAYMQSQGQELNSFEGDPELTNPPANFSLESTSDCINASIESDVYAAYQTTFGVSIKFDFNGNPRPASNPWDMGAIEFDPPVDPGNIGVLTVANLIIG